MKTYTISVLDKSPAMTHTRHDIDAADYFAAVAELHKVFKRERRSCYLASAGSVHWWHKVVAVVDHGKPTGGGVFTDRNTNSGAIEAGRIAPPQPAGWPTSEFWDVEHVCLFCGAKRWTTKRAADPQKCYHCGQLGGSFASQHNLAEPATV